MKNKILAIAAMGLLVGPMTAEATFVPVGLSPGDSYQLAFVTRGTHDALSSDINVYNAFAQSQAELNSILTGTDVGVTWAAIASTSFVDARDNALIGANVSVYLLDGTRIADGFLDMWDGALYSPLSVDQFGVHRDPTLDEWANAVWTGSSANGAAFPGNGLKIGE